jgi:hypothetical protein
MKYILKSPNNTANYPNAEIMTVPWDFINQLWDSTNNDDIFVVEFLYLIVDEIDLQFYKNAFRHSLNNQTKKIFAISNDGTLIDTFKDISIEFVTYETIK